MGSKEYKSDVTLYGKTAIVTGANTGIGKEVAKDLSKRGLITLLLLPAPLNPLPLPIYTKTLLLQVLES